jgi:hypothetical protein
MSVPTEYECYTRLLEYMRKAQEETAMLGHLANANDNSDRGRAWLSASEMLRKIEIQLTKLAMGRLN